MEVSKLRPVYGVILAGGRSRRMGGGDKGLRLLGGRPILSRVIDRLEPQVTDMLLNANGDPARFAEFCLPVVADSVAGQPGPLAGILAGLDAVVAQDPTASWIVSVPGDCPFLPIDLVARLTTGLGADTKAVVARYQSEVQPVVGLWSVALRDDLRLAITRDGLRRVGDWLQRCNAAMADFQTQPVDPFFNVNSPEDLARAETLIG